MHWEFIEMKVNVCDKDGKTYKVEINSEKSSVLIGSKIGDEIDGDSIGVPGYTLELRGGSDDSGFPMRKDSMGSGKKKILIGSGTGIRKVSKGERKRKTVRGNTISPSITQINVIVKKEGGQKLSEMFPNTPKEKKE